jgi:hypothetical protein
MKPTQYFVCPKIIGRFSFYYPTSLTYFILVNFIENYKHVLTFMILNNTLSRYISW